MLVDIESAKNSINDLLSYYTDLNEDLKSTSSSEEEQTAILHDLLGPIYAKHFTFENLHTDIILRTRLYSRLVGYLSSPSNASISCLILELKSIQKNTSILHTIRNKKQIPSGHSNLRKYILNDLAILDKVLELIERHKPKGYDIIELLFQEHIGKKADFNLKQFVKRLVSPKDHLDFIKEYSFHRNVQNRDQKETISSEAKDESAESIYIQYCMNNLKNLIDKKAPLIEQLIIMLSSIIESSQPINEDDTIECIVFSFFKQWAEIDTINTKIERTMKEVSLVITKLSYQCNHDLAIKNFNEKLVELGSKLKNINDAFNVHFKSNSPNDHRINLSEVLLIKKQGMAIKETLDYLNRKVNFDPSLLDEFLEKHKCTPLAEFVKHTNKSFKHSIIIKQIESGIDELTKKIPQYERAIETLFHPDSLPCLNPAPPQL